MTSGPSRYAGKRYVFSLSRKITKTRKNMLLTVKRSLLVFVESFITDTQDVSYYYLFVIRNSIIVFDFF